MKFKKLQYQTVKPILQTTLKKLMSIPELQPFTPNDIHMEQH